MRFFLRRWLRGSASELVPLDSWPSTPDGGWQGAAVTARLQAGTGKFSAQEGLGPGPDALNAPIVREHMDALERIPLPSAQLLDFGCGHGIYHEILAAHPHTGAWRYHGADVNAELVESCRRRWPEARWDVVKGSGRLPFEMGAFDVVLASGVLLCVESPVDVLAELHRVCGGWVVMSRVPVRKYAPSGIYLQRVWHRWGREEHPVHIFNRSDLLTLFERAGFEVEWSDHGIECYSVRGEREPVHHMLFLLRREAAAA